MTGGLAILLVAATLGEPPPPTPGPGASPRVLGLPWTVESGPRANPRDQSALVFETTVEVPGAAWMRVVFGDVRLGPRSVIVLTSQADGSSQVLDAVALRQWRFGSAYFNGEVVRVEVWAGPQTRGNAVAIDSIQVGQRFGRAIELSQCGFTDDRHPSAKAAVARILTVDGSPCTAALIGEAGCLVSAGHCFASAESVVVAEFNVPPSLADGTLVHPPARDQYAIDPRSVQTLDGGLGHDWAYFGCFLNPVTGLAPAEAQGSRFKAAAALPNRLPVTVVVTGHGIDTGKYNHIQQSDEGPLHAIPASPLHLQYEVDTQSGNSGSPLVLERTGELIGIHTHSGCTPTPPPYNRATPITEPRLRAAMARPRGVCCPDTRRRGFERHQEDVDPCVAHSRPGAANRDLAVEVADLVTLLAQWGRCADCESDFNHDGVVDVVDLVHRLSAWGSWPPPPTAADDLLPRRSTKPPPQSGRTAGRPEIER